MIPEPLNGTKDARPVRQPIAGHKFDPLNGKCCRGKVYSDISGAPYDAVNDTRQAELWSHVGTLNKREWDEIQAENTRIMDCCRS